MRQSDHIHTPRSCGRVIGVIAMVVVVCVVSAVWGQNGLSVIPDTTPTQSPTTTMKSEVRRVVVDVVVTDEKGNPVTDLKESDFKVLEDGKDQKIRSFTPAPAVVSTPVEAQKPAVQPTAAQLPPRTFTSARPQVSDSEPLNVIVWDIRADVIDNSGADYTTDWGRNWTPMMQQARLQLIDFIRKKPANARYAIILATDRLKLLQGFTEDTRVLLAAMNRPETYQIGSFNNRFIETQSPFRYTPDEQTKQARLEVATQLRVHFSEMDRNKDGKLGTLEMANTASYVGRLTQLQKVQELALWLSGVPGRKNVFWLTAAFETFGPDDDLKSMGAVLSSARVAVYPVDWRSITVSPAYDAATDMSINAKMKDGANQNGRTGAVPRPDTWVPQLDGAYRVDNAARFATMDKVAEQTGGKAFYNTNDLGYAMSSGTKIGNAAYILTYSPSNKNFRGEYRNIKVEVTGKRPYHVSYRRGYLATATPTTEPQEQQKPDPTRYAAQFGSPTSQELQFTAKVDTVGQAGPPSPEQVQEIETFRKDPMAPKAPEGGFPMPSSVQKYVLHYSVQLPAPSGKETQALIDVAVVAYDREGYSVNGVRSMVRQPLTAKQYAALVEKGLQFNQQITVPADTASLRVVVRDLNTDKVGSIDVALPLDALQAQK